MRRLAALVVSLVLLIPAVASALDAATNEYVQKLSSGSSEEKKLALSRITWSLCTEYRKNPGALEPVLAVLKENDATLREHAVYSLGMACASTPRTGPPGAQVDPLLTALLEAMEDPSPRVRQEAARALANKNNLLAIGPLIKKLRDEDPWVRLNAAFSLGELKSHESLDMLLDLLEDPSDWRNAFVKQEVLIAVQKIGVLHENLIPSLRKAFNDPYLRVEVIKTIDKGWLIDLKDLLLLAIKDPDERVRRIATEALSRMGSYGATDSYGFLPRAEHEGFPIAPGAIPEPLPHFYPRGTVPGSLGPYRDSSGAGKSRNLDLPAKRSRFARATRPPQRAASVEEGDPAKDVELYTQLLKDPSAEVRIQALGALAQLQAATPVIAALDDPIDRVRLAAMQCLGGIKDERALDAALTYMLSGKDANLRSWAEPTFMGVAERTCSGKVEISRDQGRRVVQESPPLFKPQAEGHWLLLVHPRAADMLYAALEEHKDRNVQARLVGLLCRFEDQRTEGLLLKFMDDPDTSPVKRLAVEKAPIFGGEAHIDKLIEIVAKEKKSPLRPGATWALARFQDSKALQALLDTMHEPDESLRALGPLALFNDPRVTDTYLNALKESSGNTRLNCIAYFEKHPDPRAVELLIPLLQLEQQNVQLRPTSSEYQQNENTAVFAARALGRIGDRRAVEPLINLVEGKPTPGNLSRREAVEALGRLNDKRAIPALQKCLTEGDPYLKNTAQDALRQLTKP